MRKLLAVAVMAIGVSGCGFINNPGPDTDEPAGLQRFASDQDLISYFQAQNEAAINSRGDDTAPPTDDADGGASAGADGPTAVPSPESDNSTTQDSYSTTTEQEAGVQESDIIKNDGQYLYLLSRGILRVVQATPAESMTEAGSLDLEGWGQELYLVDDKAVAIITPNEEETDDEPAADSWFAYWRPRTEVSIVSLADKATPQVAARVRFDGYVNSSRVIGDRLYMVVVNYPDYWMPAWDDAIFRVAAGEEPTTDDLLPDVVIEADGGEVYNGNISEATEIFRPNEPDGLGFTSLITVPLSNPEAFTAQTVVGYPANTYASVNAIYLTNSEWNFDGETRETTDIYKFALTEAGTSLVAAGEVPGRVLNQYSMSEHNGFLRVATTVGATWDENGQAATESSNHVLVLEQVGENLNVAGKIDNLAPGESIYSARFIGDQGYLVTFEQIDPLFTLDLSNPREPKVVGELKVPGFSTFILPLDDKHLLTIGQDTVDSPWGGTMAEGVRLSIFDISDFANPQLLTAEVIGTNGGYSEAIYNPKAFTYYAEGGLLAFPMEIYNWSWSIDEDTSGSGEGSAEGDEGKVVDDDEGEGEVDPTEPVIDVYVPTLPPDYFRGLYVYQVSVENGFNLVGRISSTPEGVEEAMYWPEFTRGAFIGDAVYSITSDCVKASKTTSVEAVVSEVEFPLPDWYYGGVDGGTDDGTSDPDVAEPRPAEE